MKPAQTSVFFNPEMPPSLHSIVAWPCEALDSWMSRQQQQLNVRGFGLPHLNLRAPFQTPLGEKELIQAIRTALRDQPGFTVRVKGWKRLPTVIFLECELDDNLRQLHHRLLEVVPSTQAPFDGDLYRPHLTLALGVLPWASDELWARVEHLTPPADTFEVSALSLTREERGEVQELHTFPLRENRTDGPAPDALP